jgi:hypothetical protein
MVYGIGGMFRSGWLVSGSRALAEERFTPWREPVASPEADGQAQVLEFADIELEGEQFLVHPGSEVSRADSGIGGDELQRGSRPGSRVAGVVEALQAPRNVRPVARAQGGLGREPVARVCARRRVEGDAIRRQRRFAAKV